MMLEWTYKDYEKDIDIFSQGQRIGHIPSFSKNSVSKIGDKDIS